MGAVESASRALRALSRQPGIFLAAAAFGLLKVPIEVTGYLHLSYVYGLLALLAFPFTPLLLAGLYGVCDAALGRDRGLERTTDGGQAGHAFTDRPGLRDAWTGIKRGYASLLLANVLYATVQHVLLFTFTVLWLWTAIVILLFTGIALELPEGQLAGEMALLVGLLVLLVLGAVYVFVRFGLAFFLQLYRPAAVVGGRGPIEAFVESIRLVRDNPRSAVGFVFVRAFVFVVLLMPGAIALISLLLVEIAVFEALVEDDAMHLLLALAVLVYCLGVVQLSFLGTYRVAFYRELVDEETLSRPEPTPSDDRPVPGGSSPAQPEGSNSGAGRDARPWGNARTRGDARTRDDVRPTRDERQSPESSECGSGPDDDSDFETGFRFERSLEPASNRDDGGGERDREDE